MTSRRKQKKQQPVSDRYDMPAKQSPDVPVTYMPLTRGDGVRQPRIFDPALKQFTYAFRAGEPVFEDEETGRRWRRARREAIDHLVDIVAHSPWSENLVLRGSLLLEAWIGAEARDPGDLDWVVVPHDVELESSFTAEMFKGLIGAVADNPDASGTVTLDATGIRVDDIWTYDRVPGQRLVFTWHAAGLPSGTVQLDFVFNERLPVPPVTALIPRAGGGEPTLVQAATPELSLAWKVLWLASDIWAQGKDLYDAVLLAERVTLPYELLRQVLQEALGERETAGFGLDMIRSWDVDWDEFQVEYPQVQGHAHDWKRRLAHALTPTFVSR
ncbi:nucleotidyltransferase AbiEii toxin of type IV toxin-antitoxin system [Nonomuraea polychroma]|uniref:Nucleotidyltransferase AbiEii toxin of type IV toxin-antitoxin system n=1 Tax=Nonomuraea polychroma TaxID=46176 RepID=A0A438LWQ4_9ACTN|nr:nucleotidyl transferase AbiEii/AbiGii toxin family protein [Nonomuraea polychroma]RVX37912.1 nucleotidyltransferase AbiEii toxin of type IV toxin-antitoxin system [Nonomuraea polychroma]